MWEKELKSTETGRVKVRNIYVILCGVLRVKVNEIL
jgi:hypothetical protein